MAVGNALGAVLLLGFRYSLSRETTHLLFLGLQVALYASHILVQRHERAIDLFDGLNLLNLGFVLHFTLPPLLLYYGLIPSVYWFLWSPDDIPRALSLIHAMAVCVQVGYYTPPLFSFQNPFAGRTPSTARIAAFVGVLAVIGVLNGMVPLVGGAEVARNSFEIALTSLVYYIPYVVLILPAGRRGAGTWAMAAVGVGITLVVSLFYGIGSKAGAANVVVAYAMYRHYFVRRIRFYEGIAAVCATVCLVAYMNYVRAVGYFAQLTWETANPFSSNNSGMFLFAGISSTVTPYEAFLVVLKTFPDILPFQHGLRLGEDMIYPLLPRVFFPWKPAIYGGAFYWDYHLGFLSLETKIFEAISLPGHFFMEFGRTAVFAGGLLLGSIQRHLYDALVGQKPTRGSICLYGMCAAITIIAARAFPWTTYTVIVSFLLPLAILWLLHAPGRRARRP